VLRRRPVLTAALTALVVAALSACSGAAAPSPSSSSTSSSAAPSAKGATAASASSSASPTSAHVADGQVWQPTSFGDQTVLQTALTGASSGVTMEVWVWTPPQYSDPAYAHTDFPVLFLYPGGDGATYNNWTDRSYGAQDVVSKGSEDGSVLPFVFVMPEMQVSKSVDTECTDMPGQPAVGTFLDTDLPDVVQHDFRVMPPGKGWGIAGASAGAYCAAAIALRHPGQYGAVVSIAGYFSMETALPQRKDPAVEALYPTALAPHYPGDTAWLFVAGTDSPLDVQAAKAFAPLLPPPSTAQTYLQPGGQHLTTSFKAAMPQVFAFFSQHLAAPQEG
jgi:S-formylglutathione hydrolase FrmB